MPTAASSLVRRASRGARSRRWLARLVLAIWLAGAAGAGAAGVVINEIFYHAPEDFDDLQWLEFFNAANEPADLSGWTVDDGKVFTFAAGTKLAAQGFLVVALETNRFAAHYHERALGPLQRPLKRGGERLQLKDAAGRVVDAVRYKDRAPWPASPDGGSASLERLCPTAAGDAADNWAASPLPAQPKPAGTPGRRNARFAATLPPVITVAAVPTDLAPNQALPVAATVTGNPRTVEVLYQVLAASGLGPEKTLAMTATDGGPYRAKLPAQAAGALLRYRFKATGADGAVRWFPDDQDLRPTLAAYCHEPWEAASIQFAALLRGAGERSGGTTPRRAYPGAQRGPEVPRPTRGTSAMVWVDQRTGVTTIFDHVHAADRPGERGIKVFFPKDQRLNGMSAVSLVFEGSERSLLAEALAYDVYRRAGVPAPQAEFVRLWVDGRLKGYHLMIERVNRSYLRRHELDDRGNLYKLLWYGGDVTGQHENHTHPGGDHRDLLDLLAQLERTKLDPEQQWQVIERSFDVDEVAGYFAVNMVLSHWDGFFNNYFTYHDLKTDKWQMYPWDQDKTWGYHDGISERQTFYELPLTFGMAGSQPPNGQSGNWSGAGAWWRPPGFFSGPLLANPRFRQVFLERVRRILQEVYTEERYHLLIDQLAERLAADVVQHAVLYGQSAANGQKTLASNVKALKTHVTKRREFLLADKELAAPAPPAKPR